LDGEPIIEWPICGVGRGVHHLNFERPIYRAGQWICHLNGLSMELDRPQSVLSHFVRQSYPSKSWLFSSSLFIMVIKLSLSMAHVNDYSILMVAGIEGQHYNKHIDSVMWCDVEPWLQYYSIKVSIFYKDCWYQMSTNVASY